MMQEQARVFEQVLAAVGSSSDLFGLPEHHARNLCCSLHPVSDIIITEGLVSSRQVGFLSESTGGICSLSILRTEKL